MSGKSTLLRAIGVNVVLACAGGPVAAASLRLPALQVGASLRNVDSLQDGRSRFLAEITRIRNISQLARDGRAVLFLLDELLSGTNSHDRRIGAAAIVKGLVDRGAIGLVTTHDLALAELEADLGHRAANVHFDDHMLDGHIEFDYKLQPGVVTHSNALELMRAVGLAV
jgi:DNA mismatch repair ATPase MutS